MLLAKTGQLNEAEAAATLAAERFAGDLVAQIQWCDSAMRRRDWAEGISRCAATRSAFPDHGFGYLVGARAMREAGDLVGAEALLAEAVERFPGEPGMLIDWADAAIRRCHAADAEHRFELLRERFPDQTFGYVAAARMRRDDGRLTDAEAMFGAAVDRFPKDLGALIDWADLALRRRDWAAATVRCALMRERFPDIAGYRLGARAAREIGDDEVAETLLAEAMQRFPEDIGAAGEHALLALIRRDWHEALRRYRTISTKFVDLPVGPLGVVIALRELREFEAARAILDETVSQFPGDPEVLVEYAWLALARRDQEEAARCFAEVRERFPNFKPGFSGGVLPLRELRRYEDLEALLAEWVKRFPGDAEPLTELGWVAQARGDCAGASERWAALRARSPDQLVGYTGGALCDRELGRYDAAETLLRQAIERFPAEPGPWADLARVAEARQDGQEAERRWTEFLARFPDEAENGSLVYNLLDVAIAAEDDAVSQAMLGAAPIEHLRQPEGWTAPIADDQALMQQFESLGDNCEFGLVQRKCGAEPLGLLRFAATLPKPLIAALRGRFEGMGEHLVVRTAPHGREYMVEDQRFGISYHAWVSVGSMGPEEVLRREVRRVPFLVRKLIDDLTLGHKLFVYHRPGLEKQAAEEIAAAIRDCGPGTLFWVTLADADHAPGTVERIGDNLLRGHIDRFAPGHNAYDFSFDCWMTLCRRAHELWRTTEA